MKVKVCYTFLIVLGVNSRKNGALYQPVCWSAGSSRRMLWNAPRWSGAGATSPPRHTCVLCSLNGKLLICTLCFYKTGHDLLCPWAICVSTCSQIAVMMRANCHQITQWKFLDERLWIQASGLDLNPNTVYGKLHFTWLAWCHVIKSTLADDSGNIFIARKNWPAPLKCPSWSLSFTFSNAPVVCAMKAKLKENERLASLNIKAASGIVMKSFHLWDISVLLDMMVALSDFRGLRRLNHWDVVVIGRHSGFIPHKQNIHEVWMTNL